jgi:hypothetical protein
VQPGGRAGLVYTKDTNPVCALKYFEGNSYTHSCNCAQSQKMATLSGTDTNILYTGLTEASGTVSFIKKDKRSSIPWKPIGL